MEEDGVPGSRQSQDMRRGLWCTHLAEWLCRGCEREVSMCSDHMLVVMSQEALEGAKRHVVEEHVPVHVCWPSLYVAVLTSISSPSCTLGVCNGPC